MQNQFTEKEKKEMQLLRQLQKDNNSINCVIELLKMLKDNHFEDILRQHNTEQLWNFQGHSVCYISLLSYFQEIPQRLNILEKRPEQRAQESKFIAWEKSNR